MKISPSIKLGCKNCPEKLNFDKKITGSFKVKTSESTATPMKIVSLKKQKPQKTNKLF